MSSAFTKVFMVPGQKPIAQVDRRSGTLYLSSDVWKGLPAEEKNFVLLHEEGHLRMETADEFTANKYAVEKFAPAGTFTRKELGQKIMVMRSIMDKADGVTTSNFTADLVAGAVSGIFQNLSILGIGSKARQKEAFATAAANSQVFAAQAEATTAQSKATTRMIVIAGVLVIVGLVIYFTLRKS